MRKRIALCFDGTWNNPYQENEREDGSKVLKPTNPLKMARAILPCDPKTDCCQLTYYDTGVGALGTYPGVSNKIVGFVDSKLGGGWGAGFEANIEQAITFLTNNFLPDDEIYVFGFSRGAAQARGMTLFIDWMGGLPLKADAYYVPLFFRHYLETKGSGKPEDVRSSSGDVPVKRIVPAKITYLGVWDTVMALGSRFLAKSGTSVDARSFHVEPNPAKCVLNARQALAIDEQRYDFRPEVWRGHDNHQTLSQRWFAGVHSNIGGSYNHDGLANQAFTWMWKEAQSLGLAIDEKFAKHYGPYPQDQIHTSKTTMYKALELIRFKRNKGIRSLVGYKSEACLELDKSVIYRMSADLKIHKRMKLYRPKNVIELLRQHKQDLDGYLTSLGLELDDNPIPEDVLKLL
ncbi:MAG: DUF2235 domain-containing protein [Hyphomicrobiales bacterium]|nr:DUF2235 domain-containing protein [Hyphomicrobiales bacterium]